MVPPICHTESQTVENLNNSKGTRAHCLQNMHACTTCARGSSISDRSDTINPPRTTTQTKGRDDNKDRRDYKDKGEGIDKDRTDQDKTRRHKTTPQTCPARKKTQRPDPSDAQQTQPTSPHPNHTHHPKARRTPQEAPQGESHRTCQAGQSCESQATAQQGLPPTGLQPPWRLQATPHPRHTTTRKTQPIITRNNPPNKSPMPHTLHINANPLPEPSCDLTRG